jgi:hypothetical protein
MGKKSIVKTVAITVGDFVLCGGTSASYPGQWYLGEVLWVGDNDALIERSTMQGETWREVIHHSVIRAFGTISDLGLIQETARKEVFDLQKKVIETEAALGAARDALWGHLKELVSGGLSVIPPDFSEIKNDIERTQQAIETFEIENASQAELAH